MRFLRLGAAGLRGEVGTSLTHQLAIRYASALGTWTAVTLKKKAPVIGVATDTRKSSEMLSKSTDFCFCDAVAHIVVLNEVNNILVVLCFFKTFD